MAFCSHGGIRTQHMSPVANGAIEIKTFTWLLLLWISVVGGYRRQCFVIFHPIGPCILGWQSAHTNYWYLCLNGSIHFSLPYVWRNGSSRKVNVFIFLTNRTKCGVRYSIRCYPIRWYGNVGHSIKYISSSCSSAVSIRYPCSVLTMMEFNVTYLGPGRW